MRVYSFSFSNITVGTANQDLFQIEALTTPITLLGFFLSQHGDVGDTEAENLLIKIQRVTDAVSNVTVEAKQDEADPALLANLNVNQTTELVTGVEIFHNEDWNIALPFVYLPIPELRPIIKIGEAMVVNLDTLTADTLEMSGTCYVGQSGS